MMEEIKYCPICSCNKFSKFLNCCDHFLSKEFFTIVLCDKCGFTFINPRPEAGDISKYYDSPDYISHTGSNKGFVNSVYKIIRKITHKRKFKLVSKYSNGKNILDIGCASGELLNLFKTNKWETIGIEPDRNAREFARSKYGLKILDESQFVQIGSGSMDVISMWHVLEHISPLNERMQEIKRILKKNGVVFIAVPNRISFDAMHYKEFWAAYDVPRHLYHFTPQSIEQLLTKHDFKIVSTLPMKFDSYYVSMLSEKYKKGTNKILNALIIGLRSNLKARAQKRNYSSMIYVVINS